MEGLRWCLFRGMRQAARCSGCVDEWPARVANVFHESVTDAHEEGLSRILIVNSFMLLLVMSVRWACEKRRNR